MTGLSQAGAQAELNALVSGTTYLALLSSDPSGLETIAALSECTDAGYARVEVTWSSATATYPSVVSNAVLLTFGPFTDGMAVPCQWLALVSSASGTSGSLLNSWIINEPQQVGATEPINIAPGTLQITSS